MTVQLLEVGDFEVLLGIIERNVAPAVRWRPRSTLVQDLVHVRHVLAGALVDHVLNLVDTLFPTFLGAHFFELFDANSVLQISDLAIFILYHFLHIFGCLLETDCLLSVVFLLFERGRPISLDDRLQQLAFNLQNLIIVLDLHHLDLEELLKLLELVLQITTLSNALHPGHLFLI